MSCYVITILNYGFVDEFCTVNFIEAASIFTDQCRKAAEDEDMTLDFCRTKTDNCLEEFIQSGFTVAMFGSTDVVMKKFEGIM